MSVCSQKRTSELATTTDYSLHPRQDILDVGELNRSLGDVARAELVELIGPNDAH